MAERLNQLKRRRDIEKKKIIRAKVFIEENGDASENELRVRFA